MFDVITVGSGSVDIFAKTENLRVLKRKDHITYPIGSKILVDELIISSGGGGTNTAASLATLGHKVAFLGKIGTHENARRIKLDLKKFKVDCSLLVSTKNSRTGYSIILDSIKHDRTILTFRGSNSDLGYNEINLKKLKTKWFLFTSLRNKSFKTEEKLVSYAKKHNIKSAFILGSYLTKLGLKKLRKILKNIEIVVLNKEEAIMLLGKKKIKVLLKKLHKLGPNIVAITDGNKGTHVFHENNIYYGKPNNVKVIETTGAGDAFASTFLSGIIKKNDVKFALQLGMTNAESVIQYHGAKVKLLTYSQALKIMKKRPIKLKILE